ncbi:hypothetical protein AYI68_g5945 [Smittium mucronatum]|uniref:Uncharacterized protein n=1 Tax=Smittium mucronatum TaxID=133383 RepID=A0A1R0GSV0_9FUNG|nr:hypothetical protein AYI68_g5945 [Smittium mucronatum]
MMPVRIPEFLYNLKNNNLPLYFLYSFLAAGIDCLDEEPFNKIEDLDSRFAELAISRLLVEEDIFDPYVTWASVFIILYHWKRSEAKGYLKISNFSKM